MKLRRKRTVNRLCKIATAAAVALALAILACTVEEPNFPTDAPAAVATGSPAVVDNTATPTTEPPTPTPTHVPTKVSATAPPTPSPTPTAEPTQVTPTITPTPTTVLPTRTLRPTHTPRPTLTPTPTPTPTPAPKPTVGPGNEQRNIFLPLAGEVQLTVQRNSPGAARSIDLLEHAVRFTEEFMGEPFPNRLAGVLFKKAAQSAEGSAGTNFGNIFTMLPEYDVDDGSWNAIYAQHLLAHEVAHFYWRGPQQNWIAEGAADFLATMSENARTGRRVSPAKAPCPYFRSISELERASLSHPADGGDWNLFRCNYSLGERLFHDLYIAVGEEHFRSGFRNLYLKLDNYQYVGISGVSEAFKVDANDETVAAVDTVIARWYDGSELFDLGRLDDSPADPDLPSLNGRISQAFISLDQEWPVETRDDLFSVEEIEGRVYLYLRFDFQVTKAQKVIPLEYVEYFEDGLVYKSRVVSHLFKPGRNMGWWRVSVGYPPSSQWATGRYGVYVYDGDRKVVAAEYEVTP